MPTRSGGSSLRKQHQLIPAKALQVPGSPCCPSARSCCQVLLGGTSRVDGGGCYRSGKCCSANKCHGWKAAEGKRDASSCWVRGEWPRGWPHGVLGAWCWRRALQRGPCVLTHKRERGKPRSLIATWGLRFSTRPEPGRKGTLHHLCLRKSRLCWGVWKALP